MDAVMHAMTTVATGGFSSHDASFAYFESAGIDVVAILFMGLGSLPFVLYVRALQGSAMALFRDSQVRAFVALVAGFTAVAWIYEQNRGVNEGLEALRYAAFNVMSIMTGTGYANHDFNAWGPFAAGMFFVLMFIGGCAGSTSCGLKVFRCQVLVLNLAQHVRQSIFPHGVFHLRYNGLPLSETVSSAVLSFFFLYMVTFGVLAVSLSLTGLDSLTAISGAATAISNVGPGLGDIIGPAGNFKPLNDPAKWLLSAGMLLGRLELLTVLVLFLPRFWRG
jgi:trk system potassium uptake protein TrkH